MTTSFVDLQMNSGRLVFLDHGFLVWVLGKRSRGGTVGRGRSSFMCEVHNLANQLMHVFETVRAYLVSQQFASSSRLTISCATQSEQA